jgi:hypothetical protein
VLGDSERVYLVRETNGSVDPEETRGREETQIHCARQHFDAIGVDYAVTASIDDIVSKLPTSETRLPTQLAVTSVGLPLPRPTEGVSENHLPRGPAEHAHKIRTRNDDRRCARTRSRDVQAMEIEQELHPARRIIG